MNHFELSNDHELTSEQIQDNFLTYCRSGNYKQVVYLFDKYFDNPGFDLNCRDNDGNTPLILAARQGHGSIIQEILRFIPDISLENKKGHTVMHLSTISIQKMIFGSVSTCIKCSERLFCNACWLGNAEIIDRSLNKENNRLNSGLTNLDSVNCFHLTIKNMELLEAISIKIKWPYKPAQVLQSLLNHWALQTGLNMRLLHLVASKCCNNAVEAARVLLKKNFSVFDQDEYEFTPIHYAARYGNIGVLELLISKINNKNDILDCPGKAGNTALHLAAIEGREECVRILLNNGAVIDLINSSNYTAAQCAKSVRIKNMLSQHRNGSGFINSNRDKVILPELSPFVLSRANTGMGHVISPPSRMFFHQSGKKSAEPTIPQSFREKSMSNPEMGNEFKEISMIEDGFPRRFPLISDCVNAVRSSELSSPPYSSEYNNPRSRLAHSIALERLTEENLTQKTFSTTQEDENKEELVGGYEFEVKVATNGDCDGGKKIKILAPAMRPKRAAIFIKKSGSTPNVSTIRNKSAQKMVLSKDSEKKSEVTHSPTKSKLNSVLINNQKKKIIKKIPEQRGGVSGMDKSSPYKNLEPEVVYESDFNTDSSSLNEDGSKEDRKSMFNKKSQSDSDDDAEQEDHLNQTLTTVRASLPRRFDQIEWRRGEQLGKGSYGIVWKGMLENGQYIAVKEIAITDEDEFSSSESSLKNIREIKREIEILQTIRHRNIVKYIGTCESLSYIYIFMEFVSGGSIAYILSKFGGFSENIIRIYSRQIVSAVAFLHDRSIIHRDLKGANIMVTPKGVIKLVDFGCAKKLETFSSNSRSLTQKSRLQGSVYWLAPEVINGVTHSNKSDIWSIGCTVVEMITTKPPWCELHPYAAMFAIGTGKKPLFNANEYKSSNDNKLSWQIIEFIDLCLTKDINTRSSSSELLTSAFLK